MIPKDIAHDYNLSLTLREYVKFFCFQTSAYAMQSQVKGSRQTSASVWISRSQSPRSIWSDPRIATSGEVQHRKSTILGLPVTLRTHRVKSVKSDWLINYNTKQFPGSRDCWCWLKGARPLGTRMKSFGPSEIAISAKAISFISGELNFVCRKPPAQTNWSNYSEERYDYYTNRYFVYLSI